MKKLGIILQDLGTSQSNYFMLQTMNYLSANNLVDCSVFYDGATKPVIDPLFSIFHVNKAYDFDGILISNYLFGTFRLINCVGTTKKYFYVWDLEWMRFPQFLYQQVADPYLNEEINLIARSQSHAKVLQNCWKKPTHVFDNWNLNKIKEICEVSDE